MDNPNKRYGTQESAGIMNSEERRIPFGEMIWVDDAPGIRAREDEVEGARWAVVEYGVGASREEWCEDGHRGYVLAGGVEYEFDDGRSPLRIFEGDAFFLPPAARGEGAHRGRNVASDATRLFLIDDRREESR